MARPPLSAEDRAAWARLVATAKPMREAEPAAAQSGGMPSAALPPRAAESRRPILRDETAGRKTSPRPPLHASETLDGGWDRRLRRGVVRPGRAIDLHGHTLASAHALLETALADAIAADLRVLLVITGKPPGPGEGRRGLIRAGIADWLAQSPQASRIAAVRSAHPRHGGAGALYVILRRARGG